jgi:hypothetical protein
MIRSSIQVGPELAHGRPYDGAGDFFGAGASGAASHDQGRALQRIEGGRGAEIRSTK